MPQTPKILVVDDESHLTYILSFKLQQAGATILSAANGLDGFDLAKSELPDLIISDYQMPEMKVWKCVPPFTPNLPPLISLSSSSRPGATGFRPPTSSTLLSASS